MTITSAIHGSTTRRSPKSLYMVCERTRATPAHAVMPAQRRASDARRAASVRGHRDSASAIDPITIAVPIQTSDAMVTSTMVGLSNVPPNGSKVAGLTTSSRYTSEDATVSVIVARRAISVRMDGWSQRYAAAAIRAAPAPATAAIVPFAMIWTFSVTPNLEDQRHRRDERHARGAAESRRPAVERDADQREDHGRDRRAGHEDPVAPAPADFAARPADQDAPRGEDEGSAEIREHLDDRHGGPEERRGDAPSRRGRRRLHVRPGRTSSAARRRSAAAASIRPASSSQWRFARARRPTRRLRPWSQSR